MPAAILFDLDGTLIRSIPAWAAATNRGLEACGIPLTNEERSSLAYLSLSDCLEAKGYGTDVLDAVCKVRDASLLPLLAEMTTWYDDALPLLTALSGMPTAIVTSAHRAAVDTVHASLGVLDHVDAVVVWEDVFPRYKPHPYPLELAAARLGVDVRECLYVGDTLPDVRCANAAGAVSCQVLRDHARREEEAMHHVASLEELRTFLTR